MSQPLFSFYEAGRFKSKEGVSGTRVQHAYCRAYHRNTKEGVSSWCEAIYYGETDTAVAGERFGKHSRRFFGYSQESLRRALFRSQGGSAVCAERLLEDKTALPVPIVVVGQGKGLHRGADAPNHHGR